MMRHQERGARHVSPRSSRRRMNRRNNQADLRQEHQHGTTPEITQFWMKLCSSPAGKRVGAASRPSGSKCPRIGPHRLRPRRTPLETHEQDAKQNEQAGAGWPAARNRPPVDGVGRLPAVAAWSIGLALSRARSLPTCSRLTRCFRRGLLARHREISSMRRSSSSVPARGATRSRRHHGTPSSREKAFEIDIRCDAAARDVVRLRHQQQRPCGAIQFDDQPQRRTRQVGGVGEQSRKSGGVSAALAAHHYRGDLLSVGARPRSNRCRADDQMMRWPAAVLQHAGFGARR